DHPVRRRFGAGAAFAPIVRTAFSRSPGIERDPSRQRILAVLSAAQDFRDFTAFLPLCLGRTREDLRLSGTFRAGSVGSPEQGGASRILAQGAGDSPIFGGLRKGKRGGRAVRVRHGLSL